MAVTVKTVKKKKPLALKKGGAKANAPAPEGEAGAEGAAPAGAPVAAAPTKEAPPVKKKSYTFAGICAILEFLMFSAILTLQIIEWRYYHGPPKNACPPYGIGPEDIPSPATTSLIEEPVQPADDELDPLDGGDDVTEDGVDEVDPLDESVPVE